ncbi:MAG: cytochrome c peroxidase [Bacteroidota bacterium]
MNTNHPLFYLLIAAICLTACNKNEETLPYKSIEPSLPAVTYSYKVNLPERHKRVIDTTRISTITDDGATLGRVLFYDKRLSLNNVTSCGSCHAQEQAFSDISAKSIGFEGGLTERNSLAITNLVSSKSFFWDSRENDLEVMVTKPIRHNVEMGLETMDDLVVKLSATDFYLLLFEKAYGTSEITPERIGKALTMFMRSMFSAESKFDEATVMGHENVFSPQEMRGFELFSWEAGCMSCHGGVDLRGGWGDDWANIGLEMNYTDPGLGFLNPEQEGMFRVPSLRNIALTAPYMHDGRFATLEEVVEHYNSGVKDHPALDWRLSGGGIFPGGPRPGAGDGPQRLELSKQDKAALVAFLHTLTDEQFINDPKFSDPFEVNNQD